MENKVLFVARLAGVLRGPSPTAGSGDASGRWCLRSLPTTVTMTGGLQSRRRKRKARLSAAERGRALRRRRSGAALLMLRLALLEAPPCRGASGRHVPACVPRCQACRPRSRPGGGAVLSAAGMCHAEGSRKVTGRAAPEAWVAPGPDQRDEYHERDKATQGTHRLRGRRTTSHDRFPKTRGGGDGAWKIRNPVLHGHLPKPEDRHFQFEKTHRGCRQTPSRARHRGTLAHLGQREDSGRFQR